jgi:hypothetical protein
MLMERHAMEIRNSKLTNHPTTSHNRTFLSMPKFYHLTFERLFIASIGKTMTSKDGAKNFRSVADASDTEAESASARSGRSR